jgi:hypothetical protein
MPFIGLGKLMPKGLLMNDYHATENERYTIGGYRQTAEEWAKTVPIRLPRMRKSELFSLALDEYNNYWMSKGEKTVLTHRWYELNYSFVVRISLNVIRHVLTDYESRLMEVYGREDQQKACAILRRRIDKQAMEFYNL